MSYPLFNGSKISTPKSYDDFNQAISAEIAEMEDIINIIMKQGDSIRGKTKTLETLDQCYLSRLGYETLNDVEKTPSIQRTYAAILSHTIKTLVEDDGTRFDDNSVFQRMKDTLRRTEPITSPAVSDSPDGP